MTLDMTSTQFHIDTPLHAEKKKLVVLEFRQILFH